ncbi:MAG: hypothetical protein Q9220_004628 [cf. Caloplaca sp. 1 TL-2023]
MSKWRTTHPVGTDPVTTVLELYTVPLLFEPGTSWSYGPSLDFAGLMIERVSGLSLQQYFIKYIWQPLDINDMTYHLDQRPDLRDRLADVSQKDPTSGKLICKSQNAFIELSGEPGGIGIFASPEDYSQLIQAVLKNDGTLLRRKTMDQIFTPQLNPETRTAMVETLGRTFLGPGMGNIPAAAPKDHGLAGILQMEDLPERKADSLDLQFVDREADLCGLYASQVLPLGEEGSVELQRVFQETMYERLSKHKEEA